MTLLIAMHIGIFYSLKITFISNTYILILLAYPWALVIDRAFQMSDAVKRDKLERLAVRLA